MDAAEQTEHVFPDLSHGRHDHPGDASCDHRVFNGGGTARVAKKAA